MINLILILDIKFFYRLNKGEMIRKDNVLPFFFFFCFLGLHPRPTEVSRLGVESELQLPAYIIAHSNTRSLTH